MYTHVRHTHTMNDVHWHNSNGLDYLLTPRRSKIVSYQKKKIGLSLSINNNLIQKK